ncbi:hypothetical protein PVL29_022866 [Vitis rotundifolia]|uniref:Uncharacterized protein n=1 Tax=Vitis rotundifolia TaxID=103349 RepID=A0AA38YX30_VITRO|nr:hypothetical protein PVL29_022866 [Vitis rotundifolia]
MAENLRADFKERRQKCLSKFIAIATPLAKRPCPEKTREAPVLNTPPTLMPPSDVVGSSSVLVAKSPTREDVVVDVCNLMRQRALLFERLEVAKAMRAFITQRAGGSEELRAKLKRVENDLAIA